MGAYEKNLSDEFDKLILDEGYIEYIVNKIDFYSNKEAKKLLGDVIEFCKVNNLQNAYPLALSYLGKMHVNGGNYKKARIIFEEAYNIFESNFEIKGMLSVITSFMAVNCMERKYGQAIKWGIKGLGLAEKDKNIEKIIAIRINMASIYFEIEEFKKALDMLNEIEDIPWVGSDGSKLIYKLNLAMCEERMDKLDKALETLEEVKELIFDKPSYLIKWLIELGRIYIKKGWIEEGEVLLETAIKRCDDIEEQECKIEAIIDLSTIDLSRVEYYSAIEKLLEIENKVKESGIIIELKQLYFNLNIAYKNLEQYEKAYFYLNKYTEREREIRQIQSDTVFANLDEHKLEIEEKNYKLLYSQNKLLYKVGQNIIANLNKTNIFKIIAEEIKDIIDYDIIQIAVYNEERNVFEYQLRIDKGQILNSENKEILEESFASYSINKKEDIIINDVDSEYYKYIKNYEMYLHNMEERNRFGNGIYTNSMIFTPMIVKNQVNGIISVQSYKKRAYDLGDLTALKILATYVGIALENASLYKKVKYNANYDGLTEVLNRRRVIEKANKLMEKCKNKFDSYYIVMIDVDNFKKVNDVYGHIIGDKVLFNIAKVIKESIKDKDLVGRYGGEEFIAIIKDENNNIVDKVESMRKAIEDLNIEVNNEKYIKVTSSIGVEKLDFNNRTLEENIALADEALYEAKSSGKNKVVFSNNRF